ncbi:MAG: ABC transporter ATP-binding protein [Ruminococcus sp.]|nr:ABC transporter ATP-binding protein [Ruminococcus sp.]
MIETFKRLWRFSGSHKDKLIKIVILNFLKNIFMSMQFPAVILLIGELLGGKTDPHITAKLVILMLVCLIGTFATAYGEQWTSLEADCNMVRDKRFKIADILKNVHLGFFTNERSEHISATLTTTMTMVENTAVYAISTITAGFFMTAIMIVFLLFYQWQIAAAALAGTLLYLAVLIRQINVSRDNSHIVNDSMSRLAAAFVSFVQGIKVTKAFNFKDSTAKIHSDIEDTRKATDKLTGLTMPSMYAGNLVTGAFEVLIIVISLALYSGGSIDISRVIILLISSFMIFSSLLQSGSSLSMIGLLDTSLIRADELEAAPQQKTETPAQKINGSDIHFENVCFSINETKILDGITVDIPAGKTTAVIGPSGSGKTTLCRLIARFWDTDSGKITIGGADITHVDEKTLMSNISMVFQNVYLFEETVENNIKLGRQDAAHEEVVAAAKAAHCHEFIEQLPDGYDTIVSEGGGSISGGEKQRISIARAILKDAPIVILDEATSALDAENERDITAAINELCRGKTVIMIAHRMETIRNADKIISIENGKIGETGTHDELAKLDGIYSRFSKDRDRARAWNIKR